MNSQSAEDFISCIRKFIALRSRPKFIVLDRAPSFIATEKVLDEVWKGVIDDPSVHSYLATEKVTFKFIPAYSPWMGRAYESQVKAFKSMCRKGLGKLTLTHDQLVTVVYEISAAINSRPLLYSAEQLGSGVMITPGDFICPYSKPGIPMKGREPDDVDYSQDSSTHKTLLNIWLKGQKLLDSMYKLWQNMYLQSLRERRNVHNNPRVRSKRFPCIGEIVLIHGENLPRGSWQLGKITDVHEISDGKIRHVSLTTSEGRIISRPINKIYPLECSPQNFELKNGTVDTEAPSSTIQSDSISKTRPTRQAKEIAAKNIQQYYSKENESDSD